MLFSADSIDFLATWGQQNKLNKTLPVEELSHIHLLIYLLFHANLIFIQ